MPNGLVVVETIFPFTFLSFSFFSTRRVPSLLLGLSVGSLRPSTLSSPVNSTSVAVASAFSPDLLCFYHSFFEVLKAMGVTGCVSCAGSTAAPTVLLTRTGYRAEFGKPAWTKGHQFSQVLQNFLGTLMSLSKLPRHFDEAIKNFHDNLMSHQTLTARHIQFLFST